ncbi:contractile injection system protein, VgrG/Pvc8 family [Lacrimispora sp.]|uniref:contractile injection system protein, VgrG/Pvc8 family n=1 Tax=Lacrimispora sp. TaxID=2719234 RepID=UPI00346140A2
MSAITYLQLETNLDCVQQIKEIKILHHMNEHGYLYLTAVLSDQYKDDYVKETLSKEQITLSAKGDKAKILFKGMIQRIRTEVEGGMYYLKIKAVSNSFQLDVKKESRSFQDKNMTYEKITRDIICQYTGGDILDYVSKERKIENLILQYEETDWEFLKRLASHFQAGLVPSLIHDAPKIVFGTPKGKETGNIERCHYEITKDIGRYMKSSQNQNSGLMEVDAVEYHIETVDDYEIGDRVNYQNKSLYIKSKEAEMAGGILKFKYSLSTLKGLNKERLYNQQIVGLSLKGTVLKSVRDKIQVHLEIDKAQERSKAWEFPYATPYTAEGHGGWYCMPEKGDTVFIYFPTKEEHEGAGINSIRNGDKGAGHIGNPDVKIFRTKNGKEMKFSQEEILITCINGIDQETGENKVVYLRLNQNNGIEIISSEPIQFKSDKGIKLEAEDTIKILASDQIRLKCKTSEIRIDSKIDICGEDVKIN